MGQDERHQTLANRVSALTINNRSNSLVQIVEEAIAEHSLSKFSEYWELCKRTVDTSDVEQFYVMVEPRSQLGSAGGYCDAAFLLRDLVVGIEGDDDQGTGNFVVLRLEHIRDVTFLLGSLPGLPRSQGALLTAVLRGVGSSEVLAYWAAKTDEEEKKLVRFTQCLIERLGSRSS